MIEEALEIFKVFTSSKSSPGKVAWNAAGMSKLATLTVIIEALV
jgi:hypothetical protein